MPLQQTTGGVAGSGVDVPVKQRGPTDQKQIPYGNDRKKGNVASMIQAISGAPSLRKRGSPASEACLGWQARVGCHSRQQRVGSIFREFPAGTTKNENLGHIDLWPPTLRTEQRRAKDRAPTIRGVSKSMIRAILAGIPRPPAARRFTFRPCAMLYHSSQRLSQRPFSGSGARLSPQ
jgi:hypothetical protein